MTYECTSDVIQDVAEKADERKKENPMQWVPKITNCFFRMSPTSGKRNLRISFSITRKTRSKNIQDADADLISHPSFFFGFGYRCLAINLGADGRGERFEKLFALNPRSRH